jgi:TorA maturation chaperone TorD
MTSEITQNKAEICRLFSILFYNPEESFLSEKEVFDSLTFLLKEYDNSYEDDAETLKNSLDIDKTELMLDYSALFVGPYQLQAPPYGSVYLDRAKIINDESTANVIEIYRSFGLEVDPDMKEPADHIAIELEFLHTALITIGNMKASGIDSSASESVVDDFLSKYYKPFVSQMCDLMQKNASTDFYKTLGSLLARFSARL